MKSGLNDSEFPQLTFRESSAPVIVGLCACGSVYGLVYSVQSKWMAILMLGLIFSAGRTIGTKVRNSGLEALFRRRQRFAQQLAEDDELLERVSQNSPIFLMLRGFREDNTRIQDQPGAIVSSPFTPFYFFRPRLRTVEALLTEAIHCWGPVLAIGPSPPNTFNRESPPRDLLPAFIVSDDLSWFEKFEKIAHRSAAFLVFPSPSKGSMDEARWIVEKRRLEDCIFVMPPEEASAVNQLLPRMLTKGLHLPEFQAELDSHWSRQAKVWEESRKLWVNCGINLPAHCPKGRIFGLSINGDVAINQDTKLPQVFPISASTGRLRVYLKSIFVGRVPMTGARRWEERDFRETVVGPS